MDGNIILRGYNFPGMDGKILSIHQRVLGSAAESPLSELRECE
jgi:hypothetical protein